MPSNRSFWPQRNRESHSLAKIVHFLPQTRQQHQTQSFLTWSSLHSNFVQISRLPSSNFGFKLYAKSHFHCSTRSVNARALRGLPVTKLSKSDPHSKNLLSLNISLYHARGGGANAKAGDFAVTELHMDSNNAAMAEREVSVSDQLERANRADGQPFDPKNAYPPSGPSSSLPAPEQNNAEKPKIPPLYHFRTRPRPKSDPQQTIPSGSGPGLFSLKNNHGAASTENHTSRRRKRRGPRSESQHIPGAESNSGATTLDSNVVKTVQENITPRRRKKSQSDPDTQKSQVPELRNQNLVQVEPEAGKPTKAANKKNKKKKNVKDLLFGNSKPLEAASTSNPSEQPAQALPFRSRPKKKKFPGRPRSPLLHSLPVPKPIDTYLNRASQPVILSEKQTSILLILDLNGTLLYRPNRQEHPTVFSPRPDLTNFMKYILSTFTVMVWSSATESNVRSMCNAVLPAGSDFEKLIAIWGRESFGLTKKQFTSRIQVYKILDMVWNNPDIQSKHPQQGAVWDQSNTVLIDDTSVKAVAHPHNLLEVPEFKGLDTENPKTLKTVAGYLENLRHISDVSTFIKSHPFSVCAEWDFKWP